MMHFKLFIYVNVLIALTFEARAQQNAKPVKQKYPVVISFYSAGSGVNRRAKVVFIDFVGKFEAKNNVVLSKGETPWGKEGEIDYCFELTVLSKKQKTKFASELKELLGRAPLVKITEDAVCLHQR